MTAPDASLHRTGDAGVAYRRALVARTGLTQAQVAERIGVDARTMRRYLASDAPYTAQFALEQLAEGSQ